MDHTVSEDTVRATLKHIPEETGRNWLRHEILDPITPAFELPWLLAIDSTVKRLDGHQQGAELGCNPHKRTGPVTIITVTSWRTCGSVLGRRFGPARNTLRPTVGADCGVRFQPCRARGIAVTGTSGSCRSLKRRDGLSFLSCGTKAKSNNWCKAGRFAASARYGFHFGLVNGQGVGWRRPLSFNLAFVAKGAGHLAGAEAQETFVIAKAGRANLLR